MNRRLITSALPYVNNIPHLGNLLQVLSADVFARFCRSKGYDTMYVCGTDEYGTATETRALQEHKTPRELCDYYHAIHEDIYKWFDISFDHFGRTSTPQQTEIVQSLFKMLDEKGFIKEHTTEQLYCPKCQRFLADRYILGTCPHCGSEDARGDQCESCGHLLEPTELINPRCSTCGSKPESKSTKHLYIDLPGIQKEYGKWMTETSEKGQWSKNSIQMTHAWIRDGLQERAITRDLKWGIPVPKPGYEDKVFYVWFDAPIGYISITKELTDKLNNKDIDWKAWWLPSESTAPNAKVPVDLFQFIGKDNIPFHTVIFPSTLIGSGKDWTKLYHMSSTEYLNYESTKFSKSKGIGVFGSDAKESGIPSDAWRFYMFYNRPEKSDTQFLWKDFQDKLNSELIGNLGNLVNRTLTFVTRYYDGKIPSGEVDKQLWKQIEEKENSVTQSLEWAELKDAFKEIFTISSIANKVFQDGEPWKTRNTDPQKAASLIMNLCYVIKDLMIMVHPYMPKYAEKVLSFFGKKPVNSRVGKKADSDCIGWSNLLSMTGLDTVTGNEIFFKPMDEKTMLEYKKRYSGHQDERKAESDNKEDAKAKCNPVDVFNNKICLKVAKILKVEKHPEADKLYIESMDDGSGVERTILSGLVPYLTPDQLLGKSVVIVDNLKPRKMRGIESKGMLLAADYQDATGKDCVEVLTCPWAKPGTIIYLQNNQDKKTEFAPIDADTFFSAPIKVVNNIVTIDNIPLLADDKQITTEFTRNGEVG